MRYFHTLTAVLLALAAGQSQAENWQNLSGNSSGISGFEKVEVRDAKAWSELWARHSAGTEIAPAVDFEREVVVGVFLGRRPTLGYSVELDAAAGLATVAYREITPSEGKAQASRISTPFALLKLNKPSGPILITPAGALKSDGTESHSNRHDIKRAAHKTAAVMDSFRDSAADPLLTAAHLSQSPRSAFDSTVKMGAVDQPVLATQSKPKCTPGVDCPEQEPKPKPKPKCTPGVDCPGEDPKPKPKPRCTPGVDCPGDGQGGGNNGRTPLPPNYRPRPSNPPSSWPTMPSRPDYYDSEVTGWWHLYDGYLFPSRWNSDWSYGNWTWKTDSRSVSRGGSETNLGQQDRFALSLNSQEKRDRSRRVYRLYWRYVGYNCHNDYPDNCLDWRIQYGWFYYTAEQETQTGGSRSAEVVFQFENDKPLLPWEKETFTISYDGSSLNFSQNGAYHYTETPFLTQPGSHVVSKVLSAGEKRRMAPEADKVSLNLVKEGGQLKLIVEDMRASYYDNEPLEIAVEVWFDVPWWADKMIYERKKNGPERLLIKANAPRQSITLTPGKAGEYYINKWSFRRVNSEISTDAWMDRGTGNRVKY